MLLLFIFTQQFVIYANGIVDEFSDIEIEALAGTQTRPLAGTSK